MSEASRKFKKVGGPILSFVLGIIAALIMPSGNGIFLAGGGGVVVGMGTRKPLVCTLISLVGFVAGYAFAKHVLHIVD